MLIRTIPALMLLSLAGGVATSQERSTRTQSASGIPVGDFPKLWKRFMPQPGHARWREIPWIANDVNAARRKAAEEGKPILMMNACGQPLGVS